MKIWEYISEQTNSYAYQFISNLTNPKAKLLYERNWKNGTNPFEVRTYIALIFLMGICKTPKICNYWQKDGPLANAFIKNIMSYTRFRTLTKFLHFSENSLQTKSKDKLFKVRNLLNFFETQWIKNYTPKPNIVIDETIIPYKGRLSIKQYMPSKPHKYGIKVYCIADSLSGYIVKWRVYTGKEEGSTNRIVHELLEGFNNQGYNLYCDNYFTTLQLIQELEAKGISLTGTVKRNRKFLPQIPKAEKPSKSNYCVARRLNNVLFVLWMDRREVFMMTSLFSHQLVNKKRGMKGGGTEGFTRPLCVERYNQFMHGVDLSNQKASYYRFQHKSKKWYKNIFYYLLEVNTINAYLIYKETMIQRKKKYMNSENFRVFVVKYWSDGGRPKENLVGVAKEVHQIKRLEEKHFLEEIAGKKRRDCRVCSNITGNLQKKTKYQCKFCQVALCPTLCFEQYHTEKNFKEEKKKERNL